MDIFGRYAIRTEGTGKPIVFVHGYGCDQNVWRFLTPYFSARNHLVLYDQMGAGQSDISHYQPSKYATLDGYAQDLVEICQAVTKEPVTVVAHSVGCMIAALAAKARPDLFEKLVMIGPSPCYIDDDGYEGGFTSESINDLIDFLAINHAGWAAQMAPVIMGNPSQPELAQELERSFCRNDPKIAHNFAIATFQSDNRDDLPHVTVPTLILQSVNDAVAPVSVGQYMSDKMPQSTLVLVGSDGHCPHMSAPAKIAEAILAHTR